MPWWYLAAVAAVLAGLLVLRILTKKRVFGTLLVIGVLAVLALAAYQQWGMQGERSPLAEGERYTVTYGTVAEVVEATGNLAPIAQVNVAFATAGTLTEVRVSIGDRVTAGQVLAVLDTTDLALQVAQSRAGVAVAEANLQKVLAGARTEDVVVAQNSLAQARSSLAEQEVSLSAAEEQARLSWVTSANALRDAQANYANIYWDNRKLEDRIGQENVPDSNYDAEDRARRAMENAEAAMEQARLSYEQAKQRQESSLRTARSQVSTAQANLDKVTAGATETDTAAAQASVAQSKSALDVALAQMEKATLRAPFSGVVGRILADIHTPVTTASPILVLFDPSAYYVDVEVDEVDISTVQLGQQVRITLDALPEVDLEAWVAEVSLTPSGSTGVVTYRVRVRLEAVEDPAVRVGMTANVGIVAQEKMDVLIVPRRAVRLIDGRAYVERVLPEEKLESVEVQMGLADPQWVEIVSGLQEGDEVFVRGVVQRDPLQQFLGSGSGGFR